MEQEPLVRILLKERAKLTAYIWSIVRDVHVTDDVYQDLCVKAIAKREQIRDRSHLLAWCRRVARDEAVTVLRRSGRQPMVFDTTVLDLLETEWQSEDAHQTNETVEALRLCIEQLTPNNQRILRLRYMQNLPGAQVAAELDRKLDTVYKALTRIHKSLLECIERRRGKGVADA
ncbi:sigma-70 family RNA polymerase sigma factor [Planctomycetales bacterium ZRK34]|nr:sigma-70 family RNA polymerase sigma factor [Planctomycetales bacterium ZRK34]